MILLPNYFDYHAIYFTDIFDLQLLMLCPNPTIGKFGAKLFMGCLPLAEASLPHQR